MSRAYLARVAVPVFAFGVWVSTWAAAGAEESTNANTISAADLSSGKVVVIGRLGLELQTMMTIRGTWHYPEQKFVKDYSLRFRVTHVDGKKLSQPVDFEKGLVRVTRRGGDDALRPADGETWEFRGFESGQFRERPAQYYIENGGQSVQTAYGGFTTDLEGFMPAPEKAEQRRPADESEKSGQQKPKKP